jgi:short chain dehydrogenase
MDAATGLGRLAGKIAVITGTGGGQGRAAALLFAAEGATVVGCDLKVDGATETVELVRAARGQMDSSQPLDLSDEEAVRRGGSTAPRSDMGRSMFCITTPGPPASTRSTRSPTKTGSSPFVTSSTSCFSPPSTRGRT